MNQPELGREGRLLASPAGLPGAEEYRSAPVPGWLSLACEHPAAYRAIDRYLRHLAHGLEHLGPAALRLVIHVVDPEDVPAVPPGATALAPRDRYAVARLGAELIYTAARRVCVRVEPAGGLAEVWTTAFDTDSVADFVSIAVLETASFRGFFGLHAGAVVRDGLGYLLPGASGSGKTSVCLTLVRAGFRYLTDDFVLLRAEPGGLRCVPFFRTFNVDASWGTQFPELAFVHDLPPLAHGKRMFDPEACYPGSHVRSACPAVLVFPRIVTDQDSTVRELSKRQAFCRLLPQIRLSADTHAAEAHLHVLGALVRDCVAFELQHGRDFLQAPVATLHRLLESFVHETAAPARR